MHLGTKLRSSNAVNPATTRVMSHVQLINFVPLASHNASLATGSASGDLQFE